MMERFDGHRRIRRALGFDGGMDVAEVGRDESDRLGLTKPNEHMKPVEKDFNDNLQASTRGLDPRLINFLRAAFGDRVKFEGDSVSWNAPKDSTPSEE